MEGRKKPFTEFERSFIINLIQQNAAVVENKKTDGVTSQKKQAAWQRIAEKYNASTRISQKVDIMRLKKFWNNLKMKSRDAKTKENQRNFTGCGPAVPDINPENALVLSTVPNLLPVIITDSDAVKGQKDDDDDSQHWTHLKNREEVDEPDALPELILIPKIEIIEEENQNTPETSSSTIITQIEDTPGPSQLTYSATTDNTLSNKRRRLQSTGSITDHPTIENLKLKIMEQDLSNRARKNEIEIEHLKNIQELELKLKQKEIDHKTKMFNLYEEEMKLKIELLKSNKNNCN